MSDFESQKRTQTDGHEAVSQSSSRKEVSKRVKKSSGTTDFARARFHEQFEDRWEEAKDSAVTPDDKDPFAAGGTDRKAIGGKHPKQGGYAQRLHDSATNTAPTKAGHSAVPAAPHLGAIQAGMAEQQKATGEFQARAREIGSGRFNSEKAELKRALYSADWAIANQATLTRYEFEQLSAIAAYNSWCPMADAANLARQELVETARLMGFDLSKEEETAAFVAAMETSLGQANQLLDAKVLKGKAKTSWSQRNDDLAAHSAAQPELKGSEVTKDLEKVPDAYKSLQLAYKLVYEGLLKDRAKVLRAEASGLNAKVEQINKVITFWTSATDFYVNGVSAVGGVANGSLGNKIQKKVGPKLEGDKQALADWKYYNESYGKRPNVPDHYGRERAAKQIDAVHNPHPAAGAASPMADEGGALPSLSPSSIVKFGLELLFKADVEKLKTQISALEGKAGATDQTTAFVSTLAVTEQYKAAAEHLRTMIKDVDADSLQERQQDYLQLGADLDRYAMEHASDLRAQGQGGIALRAGEQRHGTTMAVLAKIDQYKALSALALATFNYDSIIGAARGQVAERGGIRKPQESANRSLDHAQTMPPALPQMPAEEQDVYHHIGGTYLGVLKQDEEWRMRLERVSQGSGALMKRLTGSADSPSVVGKKF